MTAVLHRLVETIRRWRRLVVVVLNLGLVALSDYLAFILRFEGPPPPMQVQILVQTLPWLLVIRAAAFVPLRLYEGLWRYTSVWDLRNIIAAVVSSTAIFYTVINYGLGITAYSKSVLVIDALLLIFFMGGMRLTRRIYRAVWRQEGQIRVLIYGAGDAGEMIVRDMKTTRQCEYRPVGFVDDDRGKVGERIHGVPVLGTRDDLRRIVREKRPAEVLIAMPGAEAGTLRTIARALEPFRIKITTLPTLREIADSRVAVSQIRNLAAEDVLTRAPVGLDSAPARLLIEGRRVMVTGAGGSIGSELCRQIAMLNPATLVLFERYENNLFAIANDLEDRDLATGVTPVVGDVTDAARLDAVLEEHRPEIIFHAAAHKHVPLMEQNPCEAVKNNVFGTRLITEAAERHGVDRFILISSDKAVNPTSVMGTTKRIAEMLVQCQANGSGTSFSIVRFGNVLASNGSVVPRFVDQIRAGGPVTVTHPDMRRYFMLISEAVQLVLHAAAQGESGGIYVLEMGEQLKLLDVAHTLIRLAGFVPDEDIPVVFVGLRPGEKLHEELIGAEEVADKSQMEKILKVRHRNRQALDALLPQVTDLERFAFAGRTADVLAGLHAIVPEFAHQATQNSMERVPAFAEKERSLQQPDVSVRRSCALCYSRDVHRSRPQTLVERARLALFRKQVYRCLACGWRGWQVPQDPAGSTVSQTPLVPPNLALLDARMQTHRPAARPVFTPRDLS